jgi:acyl-coenzyme A thioesterase PaaI-like protein
MTDEAELAAMTAGVRQLIPLFDYMGLEVLAAGEGHAAARIPSGPNGNHFGVIYAGALYSVAEMLGGVIGTTSIALDGFIPIVKDMQIRFLRPATTAVTASTSLSPDEIDRVKTEALESGKADYVLTTDVIDENGVVVASTSATYQVRRM